MCEGYDDYAVFAVIMLYAIPCIAGIFLLLYASNLTVVGVLCSTVFQFIVTAIFLWFDDTLTVKHIPVAIQVLTNIVPIVLVAIALEVFEAPMELVCCIGGIISMVCLTVISATTVYLSDIYHMLKRKKGTK